DQGLDALGLGQVHASVREGAARELPGLGRARAGVERGGDELAQDLGRAVGGQLEQVLPRGRLGAFPKDGDDAVDRAARAAGRPRRRPPRLERRGAEQFARDAPRAGPADADHAESPAPRRSGRSDDGLRRLDQPFLERITILRQAPSPSDAVVTSALAWNVRWIRRRIDESIGSRRTGLPVALTDSIAARAWSRMAASRFSQ